MTTRARLTRWEKGAHLATMVGVSLTAGSLIFAGLQIRSQTTSQQVQFESHLQERMTELDEYFAEHTELYPYFYNNLDTPATGNLRAEVLSTGEMLVDFAATVASGLDGMDGSKRDQWQKIMAGYWCSSPTMRDTWKLYGKDYEPETADLLGRRHGGKPRCDEQGRSRSEPRRS